MLNSGDAVARRLDDIAFLLGGLLVVTLLGSAALNSSDALPALLTLTCSLGCYAIGRSLGRRHALPALLTVALGVAAVVIAFPDILSGKPLAPPLDYGNANGALLAVGATAATALAVSGQGVTRQVGWTLAPLLVVATAMTGSRAATALALVVVVSTAASLIVRGRGARWIAGCAVGAIVLVVAGTIVLGFTYDGPGTAPSWAATPLSERRIALWHDAVVLIDRHPIDGVGPGRFPTASPVARGDPDTRFAHSLPLELGAEAGVAAGLSALALLVALAAAATMRRRGAPGVVATWAVVIFALQASIDYIYRFPAIVLLAALVAGLTSAVPDDRLSGEPQTAEESPKTALDRD